MAINIAVLGPKDLVSKTIEEGMNFQDLNLKDYGYGNESQTLMLAEKAQEHENILLFTGPIPYYMARNSDLIKIPMIYVSYSGTAFYKVLFSYLEQIKWDNTKTIRFSIDTIHEALVEEMLEELGIYDYKIYVKEYEDYITTEEIIEYHNKLYNEGKTDVAITCLTSAYDKLIGMNIPTYRITPTVNCIREALRLAKTEAKNVKSMKGQLCIGILKISNWNEMNTYVPSEYTQQRLRLNLMEMFIDFCEKIKASMKIVNEDEYIFYATRGAIEDITENYKYMPIIKEVNDSLPFKISIGLGFGYTANQAEQNSQEAIKYCGTFNKNCCYVVMEDGMVMGPLERGKNIEFYSRSEDEALLKLAEKSKVSVGTLNKIVGLTKALNKDVITANDIADTMNITLRSARRILSALEEADIAKVVGEEQPAGRGRPRQIFKILI
ncbi:hypothetical protein [Desnuesiella massiliensis]|uniref:hypothetical protein n=1 Tax=Desnuesiella massiliensis TaxID=1650662 RepID=UPI0006E36FF3|nr:hypothetical protein [Desnuesiella massiliensis]